MACMPGMQEQFPAMTMDGLYAGMQEQFPAMAMDGRYAGMQEQFPAMRALYRKKI